MVRYFGILVKLSKTNYVTDWSLNLTDLIDWSCGRVWFEFDRWDWSANGIGRTGRKPCDGLPPFRSNAEAVPSASRSPVHLKVTSFLLVCQSVSILANLHTALRHIDPPNCVSHSDLSTFDPFFRSFFQKKYISFFLFFFLFFFFLISVIFSWQWKFDEDRLSCDACKIRNDIFVIFENQTKGS